MHDLAIKLETRASEAAELRSRLELAEQTQSTIEEERNRLAGSLRQAEEQAEMLRKELEAERSKGFWQRLFGG
jgi:vacuolar-type H+-ATPase subunit D/Vma8